jgi:hypothetical protein
MLNTIRCWAKGHLFVDSRSQPGTQVCVRCRHRQPFEGLVPAQESDTSNRAQDSLDAGL